MHIDNPLIWGETPLQNQNFHSLFLGCMAHNPIFGSDSAKPGSPAGEGPVESVASAAGEMAQGSDLADLAAKFAAHGGGRVSRELSADLALEVVLNEIVEQACLATGASGAALVLERDGEWVCRASTGGTAPQLGARLNAESGLSGACVKTLTVQRCDDAQNDPRADVEACRTLGVRSVIILPMLKNGQLAGIFEAFSTLPSRFGERDERTLEALARRVLRNLERASGPMSANTEASRETRQVAESFIAASTAASAATPDRNQSAPDRAALPPVSVVAPGRKMNLVTLALGAAVLAYAVLLTVLAAQRLSGRRAASRVRPSSAVSAALVGAANQSAGSQGKAASSTSPSGTQSAGSKSSTNSANPISTTSVSATSVSTGPVAGPAAGASGARDTSLPAGSLRVYENGKEIFRMNPAAEKGEATSAGSTKPTGITSASGGEVQRAATVEPAGILTLPAEAAEASLLHRVEPDYPEAARQQRVQGTVVLDLRMGQDGRVREVTAVSGPPLLAQAATAAVKQWRFKPRLVGGHPAEMQTRIALNFQLPH
jgi:TonB family protein